LTVAVAREQRLVFGEVAEVYDRARPPYPAALVDASLDRSREVLEGGAGSGNITWLCLAWKS
jgi:hypothetical protein